MKNNLEKFRADTPVKEIYHKQHSAIKLHIEGAVRWLVVSFNVSVRLVMRPVSAWFNFIVCTGTTCSSAPFLLLSKL